VKGLLAKLMSLENIIAMVLVSFMAAAWWYGTKSKTGCKPVSGAFSVNSDWRCIDSLTIDDGQDNRAFYSTLEYFEYKSEVHIEATYTVKSGVMRISFEDISGQWKSVEVRPGAPAQISVDAKLQVPFSADDRNRKLFPKYEKLSPGAVQLEYDVVYSSVKDSP
jgi:hypothetical protein